MHEREIRNLIAEAIQGLQSPRILISGATDEELLRIIHLTLAEHRINPVIDVVDICTTPLGWMNEYAALENLNVKSHCADILDFSGCNRYDLIVTHAFLGYFNAKTRPKVITKWWELLRKNGQVITIQRIREGEQESRVSFKNDEYLHFVSQAVTVAMSTQEKISLAQVKLAAELFASKFSTHPISSELDFQNLFSGHGFRLKRFFSAMYPSHGRLSGPSVPSGGKYAFVVAEKQETKSVL